MGKNKSDDKKKKKTSQLVIRIDKSERDAFVRLCDANDTSAAREIRRFMRDWVVQNASAPEAIAAEEAPKVESPPAAVEVAVATPEASAEEAAAPQKPTPAKRKRSVKTPA